jgi:alkylation response protein AidB-like acyl-CoA dehydrogenase
MQRFGDPSFDLFKLSDEHNELRAVLRDLCEKEIAPYAADVDESSRFPEEALKVLNDTGFSAVHVSRGVRRPGRRLGGGVHRDRRGRSCVAHTSSLIPASTKLGHDRA